MATKTSFQLSPAEYAELLQKIAVRFSRNMLRHPQVEWPQVEKLLHQHAEYVHLIHHMEATGGEPDVVSINDALAPLYVMDCAAESPAGRRSLCYDDDALNARKENKPGGSAMGMAGAMGISLLTEADYRLLQSLGPVDEKTSSWLLTPEPIRKLGGAIFGDYRYGQVFVYHNGVQSYYAARGFRGKFQLA